MAGVTQNVSRLNQKQVMNLLNNRGLAKNGKEYCLEALKGRWNELSSKPVEIDVLAEMNALVTFPPPIKKARKSKIVAKPVEKSGFALIGHGIEKLVYPKSKIKFELRY